MGASTIIRIMTNWKRTFAIIWTGQFLSLMSSSVVGFAVIFWLSIETGSAEVLALATMAAFLPQGVLGLVAGVFVDRWNRKLTMILSDSFIALCMLLLAILFWLDCAEIWQIYLLLAARSVGSAFHMPAMQASVPLLAPTDQLTRIAGIDQVINSLCNIVAPAVGALLIGICNMGTILMLDVVGAILACVSLLFVRIPRVTPASTKLHLFREIKESFTVIHARKGLVWLFFFAIMGFVFIAPVAALFPLMTLQHFGGDTFDMGIVETLWGGGALLGGTIIGLRNYRINKVVLINAMYILLGLYLVLSGLLTPGAFGWFVALTAVGGCALAVYNAVFVAIVQTHIEFAVLGRVLSIYYSVSILPAMVGLLGTGFLADTVGIAWSFVWVGVAYCVIGVCAFLPRGILRLGRLQG